MRYELTGFEWIAIGPFCRTSPVACRDGLPVRLELTTGESHDSRLVTDLLSGLKSGSILLADQGYDADWIRALVSKHGAWANMPPKLAAIRIWLRAYESAP